MRTSTPPYVSSIVLLAVRYKALRNFQVSIAISMGIFFRKLGNYGKTGDYIEIEVHGVSLKFFNKFLKILQKKNDYF